MERNTDSKRNRVSWKNVHIAKTFLDACINEIAINGREGGSLKRMSWKKVSQTLGDTHNFTVDRKQLKNHFDYLKSKYGAWLDLKHNCGNIYDPSTNTFNLTDEEWENEIKKNKYVETLRNTSLLFPDLCAQLFDGAMSMSTPTGTPTGIKSREPISAEPITAIGPHMVEEDEDEDEEEEEEKEEKEEEEKEKEKEEEMEIPKDTMGSISSSSSQPPVKVKERNKQKKGKRSIEEEILGVVKIIADKMKKPEAPQKPTFDDCVKKLNELGWEEDDHLRVVAFAIFCDKNDNYRECWMKLTPKMCPSWVRMIGRGKGFIK